MTSKYGDKLQVLNIARSSPRIKITPIFIQLSSKEEVIDQLTTQNPWIDKASLEVESFYVVTSTAKQYTSLIIKCTTNLFNQLIERRTLFFGMNVCRCYEHIRLIQCYKCQRFGHFSAQCTSNQVCRVCANDHQHKNCNAVKFSCANFIKSNAMGKHFDTAHKTTDSRCPSRNERIIAIKESLLK